MTTRIAPPHDNTTDKQRSCGQPDPEAHRPARTTPARPAAASARLDKHARASGRPMRVPGRACEIAVARLHRQPAADQSCVGFRHLGGASHRVRLLRVAGNRTVGLHPLPRRSATFPADSKQSTTNSPTADELGFSCPALLCHARVLVASHVLATCATVHVTPLILSLRAWGGGWVTARALVAASAAAADSANRLEPPPRCAPRCRTTLGADEPTLNTARCAMTDVCRRQSS